MQLLPQTKRSLEDVLRSSSLQIALELDANHDGSIQSSEMENYIESHQDLWKMLSDHCNLPKEECIEIARNVAQAMAIEYSSGKKTKSKSKTSQKKRFLFIPKKPTLSRGASISQSMQHLDLQSDYASSERGPTVREMADFHYRLANDQQYSLEYFHQTVFCALDQDHSGFLEVDEIQKLVCLFYDAKSLLKADWPLPPQDELQRVVLNQFDLDGDNRLTFEELVPLIEGGASVLKWTQSNQDSSIGLNEDVHNGKDFYFSDAEKDDDGDHTSVTWREESELTHLSQDVEHSNSQDLFEQNYHSSDDDDLYLDDQEEDSDSTTSAHSDDAENLVDVSKDDDKAKDAKPKTRQKKHKTKNKKGKSKKHHHHHHHHRHHTRNQHHHREKKDAKKQVRKPASHQDVLHVESDCTCSHEMELSKRSEATSVSQKVDRPSLNKPTRSKSAIEPLPKAPTGKESKVESLHAPKRPSHATNSIRTLTGDEISNNDHHSSSLPNLPKKNEQERPIHDSPESSGRQTRSRSFKEESQDALSDHSVPSNVSHKKHSLKDLAKKVVSTKKKEESAARTKKKTSFKQLVVEATSAAKSEKQKRRGRSSSRPRCGHRRNSDLMMSESRNPQVEAEAEASITSLDNCRRAAHTKSVKYWDILRHQFKKAAAKDSMRSCLKTSDKPTSRNNLCVHFAVDEKTNRVWATSKTFERYTDEERGDIWWHMDEMDQTFRDRFVDVDIGTEGEYGKLIHTAFDSVHYSDIRNDRVFLNFPSFVSCAHARGLEQSSCPTIGIAVELHRRQVLQTYEMLANPEAHDQFQMDTDLQQEILRLRSMKFSHASRMVAQKLAECDASILVLFSSSD